jgi:hypothetical protein
MLKHLSGNSIIAQNALYFFRPLLCLVYFTMPTYLPTYAISFRSRSPRFRSPRLKLVNMPFCFAPLLAQSD